MLHHAQDVVFTEATRYTAPNTADEAILIEHFYRDVIHKPRPTEKQPIERQMEELLDDDPPSEPPKPKKKSQESAGLETSLGDAWKPPAEGNHQNCAGKETFAESAQFALEDNEFKDMIPISAVAAISDDHEDAINEPNY